MFCVIPIGGTVSILGHTTFLQVANLPIGRCFILAMSGLGVYGVMLAGWSSGSKVPAARRGAFHRAAAFVRGRVRARDPRCADPGQTLSTHDIAAQQGVAAPRLVLDRLVLGRALVPFAIFLIRRDRGDEHPPFDLVEAEQEPRRRVQTPSTPASGSRSSSSPSS